VARTNEEIHKIVSLVARWVKFRDGNVTLADVHHSALLYRLLSDKEPLTDPPPKAYSQPWYELAEGKKCSVFDIGAGWPDGNVSVAHDSRWRWESSDKKILIFNPTGDKYEWTPNTDSSILLCGWLQKISRREVD